jgi:hypothetical protein
MDGSGPSDAAALDGRRLLIAAMPDWSRPVAHCPGWDAAELVRHTGTILEWMAAVELPRVSFRTRPGVVQVHRRQVGAALIADGR